MPLPQNSFNQKKIENEQIIIQHTYSERTNKRVHRMNGANFEIPENKKMMRWKCARELYSYIEHKKYNRTIKMWLFIGVASAISPFNCRLYARSDFMLSRLFHLLRSGRSLLTHSHHFFLLLRSSIFILGLFWLDFSMCI